MYIGPIKYNNTHSVYSEVYLKHIFHISRVTFLKLRAKNMNKIQKCTFPPLSSRDHERLHFCPAIINRGVFTPPRGPRRSASRHRVTCLFVALLDFYLCCCCCCCCCCVSSLCVSMCRLCVRQTATIDRRSMPPSGYITHTVSAPSLHGKTGRPPPPPRRRARFVFNI